VPVPTSDTVLRDRLQNGLSAALIGLNAMLPLTTSVNCPDVLVDGAGNVLVPANPVAVTEPDPVSR
jgi:hypothetical protein